MPWYPSTRCEPSVDTFKATYSMCAYLYHPTSPSDIRKNKIVSQIRSYKLCIYQQQRQRSKRFCPNKDFDVLDAVLVGDGSMTDNPLNFAKSSNPSSELFNLSAKPAFRAWKMATCPCVSGYSINKLGSFSNRGLMVINGARTRAKMGYTVPPTQ